MRYAELHCRSYFSFLDGASSPEDLVARANELGYRALALTDIDGIYGVAQAHSQARDLALRSIVGSELTVVDDLAPPLLGGASTAHRIVVLAQNHQGYTNLCRLITIGRTRCNKGSAWVSWNEVSQHSQGLFALSGGSGGPIDAAWRRRDLHTALAWAKRLQQVFGSRAHIELTHHLAPGDDQRIRSLVLLAQNLSMPTIVSQDVRFASPHVRHLYDVQTCIREKTTLDRAGRRLSFNSERYLHTLEELEKHFHHFREALATTADIAEQCSFSLEELRYRFPQYELPAGETPFSHLHRLTYDGARERYQPMTSRAANQLAHELSIIEKLNLAGYFLIVWDIVRFCRERKILCQGRGSAANSAVCYALGITAVDPVRMELLFERFLSEERDEMPDIDIDIASDRREEVIQYVYRRFGQERVSMSCNVITYHARSAIRDIGKVFGLSQAQVDRAAKAMAHHMPDLSPQGVPTSGYAGVPQTASVDPETRRSLRIESGLDPADPVVQKIFAIAHAFESFPRHLGIHPGGMVISAGPMHEVVPVENATMEQRTVVQWDKDDINSLGIIKIDLLGLGMLTAIDKALDLLQRFQGITIDLSQLQANDPDVYDMICRGDTIGVFQIESRAQMNMLPRLRPRTFYDLVVEVAIIRPGPIQGDMIHPYLRRRNGTEAVEYEHQSLEPVLRRTLGVPLFQEQGMKLAVAAAGFTAAEADQLRRAMGHKRSRKRMAALQQKLIDGMRKNNIPDGVAERIFNQLCAFADYGFPESHSASFALIVYASCFLKHHYPAAFTAALINSQPMGFYAPNTLLADARRHGVSALPPCAKTSQWEAILEGPCDAPRILLGFQQVHGIGNRHREHFERERARSPFVSMPDFVGRSGLPRPVLARLAAADAFRGFGLGRRESLWHISALPEDYGQAPLLDHLEHKADHTPTRLKQMTSHDELIADFKSMGMSVLHHPMKLFRKRFDAAGIRSAETINSRGRDGDRATIAGMVITRQRPGSAKGMMFITLEDETGLANLVVTPPIFDRFRPIARSELLILARGTIERQGRVVNLMVEHLETLRGMKSPTVRSRDFR